MSRSIPVVAPVVLALVLAACGSKSGGATGTGIRGVDRPSVEAQLSSVVMGQPTVTAKEVEITLNTAGLADVAADHDYSLSAGEAIMDAQYVMALRLAATAGMPPQLVQPAGSGLTAGALSSGAPKGASAACPEPVVPGGADLVFFTIKEAMKAVLKDGASICSQSMDRDSARLCGAVAVAYAQWGLGIQPPPVSGTVNATPGTIDASIRSYNDCLAAQAADATGSDAGRDSTAVPDPGTSPGVLLVCQDKPDSTGVDPFCECGGYDLSTWPTWGLESCGKNGCCEYHPPDGAFAGSCRCDYGPGFTGTHCKMYSGGQNVEVCTAKMFTGK